MHAANVDKIITEDLDFEKLHISSKTKVSKIYKIKINNSTAALQDFALNKPSKPVSYTHLTLPTICSV